MHEVFQEDAAQFRQRAEEIKTLLGAAVPGKPEGAAA
jgi:hypothetical protein